MSESWASPGGVYVVPDAWQERFLSDFPDYRVRWSLRKQQWQVEQRVGAGALPPLYIDPFHDDLIRARDGFWLVRAFQPGDRMACPVVVDRVGNQRCGADLRVPFRESVEVRCENCRRHGRDGRTMAAFWPFDETLIEDLRFSDPLRGGTQRLRASADAANRAMLAEAEWRQRDANTSLDYVDYRWLHSIPTAGATRRRIDAQTFR